MTFLFKTYVAGYKIDKKGVNIPTIAAINSNPLVIKYWSFEHSINNIFVHKNSVHVSDSRGNVFILENDEWQKSELVFPVAAKVIFSDKHQQMIICYPASLLKEGDANSGCYSLNDGWKYSFFWQHTTPKICDEKLYIFEESRKGGVLRKLSLKTGELLFSKELVNAPKNMCSTE